MQDRYRRIDKILLRRTAGPYIGSIASILAHPSEVRFTPDSDQKADVSSCPLSADSVEKLKNDVTAKFRGTHAEADFRQCNAL